MIADKLKELIEKYKQLDNAEQMVESGEVLQDLQSLQQEAGIDKEAD